MSTLEILKQARELIAKPGGWCRGCCARDAEGRKTGVPYVAGVSTWTEPVSFCAFGAPAQVAPGDGIAYDKARDALRNAMPGGEWSLPTWNDEPGRTQAEVVALFDRAIEAETHKAEGNR